MDTYTIKWRDADADHTFDGMQDTSVVAFASALIVNASTTLVSVTLDGDDTRDIVR